MLKLLTPEWHRQDEKLPLSATFYSDTRSGMREHFDDGAAHLDLIARPATRDLVLVLDSSLFSERLAKISLRSEDEDENDICKFRS